MFNNLGFWAAGAGTQTFDFDLIATGFGSGTSTSVTFDSIPQAYKQLQIRYVAKSTTTATTLRLRFNGSSASVYTRLGRASNNGSIVTTEEQNDTGITLPLGVAPSSVTGIYSGGIIDVIDYADAKTKQVRAFSGYFSDASVRALDWSAAFFNDTSAISSIEINTGGANFLDTASRFSLYGIKG